MVLPVWPAWGWIFLYVARELNWVWHPCVCVWSYMPVSEIIKRIVWCDGHLSVAGRCPFFLIGMSGPLTSLIFWLESACFQLFNRILSPQRHVRTHSHSVDVGHVSGEGLPAHAVADVPQLGGGVAGSWDEGLVVWTERQAHHVPSVAGKGGGLLARLDVPQCTARSEFMIWVSWQNKHPSPSSSCCVRTEAGAASLYQVVSPELVRIWLSSMKRQQDR